MENSLLKKARVIDPIEEAKAIRQRDKEKQMSTYGIRSEAMKEVEVRRLIRKKKNPGYRIVTEFDCGSKPRRRRTNANTFD